MTPRERKYLDNKREIRKAIRSAYVPFLAAMLFEKITQYDLHGNAIGEAEIEKIELIDNRLKFTIKK